MRNDRARIAPWPARQAVAACPEIVEPDSMQMLTSKCCRLSWKPDAALCNSLDTKRGQFCHTGAPIEAPVCSNTMRRMLERRMVAPQRPCQWAALPATVKSHVCDHGRPRDCDPCSRPALVDLAVCATAHVLAGSMALSTC